MDVRSLIPIWLRLAMAVVGFGWAQVSCAGLATDINGLYYTGINNAGSLLAGGATDPHWSVTYARANGVSGNATYQGAAYVVSSTANSSAATNYIDYAWVQNTATAQWITTPGAQNPSGTSNVGGVLLPGNGTTGTNRAQYIYTLGFNVSGTGSGTITNAIVIDLTIAADDQYSIYVNPTLNANGSIAAGQTPAFTRLSAWTNTTSATLQNGTNGTGTSGNSVFVVGTNRLVVVVDNTNSVTGTSTATAINPSGFLMYQVGALATIDGRPVPEPGTLASFGAVGLFAGLLTWRRRRRAAAASAVSTPTRRE